MSYHNWWYTNRDTDQNGIAEYGAMVDDAHYQMDDDGNFITDENGNRILNPEAVIEAAAWESGMDNAPALTRRAAAKGASASWSLRTRTPPARWWATPSTRSRWT